MRHGILFSWVKLGLRCFHPRAGGSSWPSFRLRIFRLTLPVGAHAALHDSDGNATDFHPYLVGQWISGCPRRSTPDGSTCHCQLECSAAPHRCPTGGCHLSERSGPAGQTPAGTRAGWGGGRSTAQSANGPNRPGQAGRHGRRWACAWGTRRRRRSARFSEQEASRSRTIRRPDESLSSHRPPAIPW